MRFLADENVPRPIVVWLRSQGQDVLSAAETRVQTSDADLLRITLPRGRRPRRAGNGDRPAARTQRRQPKARRGVRVRRPTRPAGPRLRSAGPSISARHGTTTWTWQHAPERNQSPSGFSAVRETPPAQSAGEAKTVVGVAVRRRVPVTVRRADVRRLIVERPAPKQTRVWPPPAGTAFYETGRSESIGIGVAGMADPAHDPGTDRVEADPAGGELALHPAHPAAEAADVLLSQEPMRREDPVTEEPDSVPGRENDALVRMDAEPQLFEESADLVADLVQPPLVVGEDQEVVDVADIAQPQPVGDEVVQRVEVDIGEELAGLVAQRQSPAPLGGREQVVAGEPHQHRLLRIAVVDDEPDQLEHMRVLDLASDQPFEDLMVDGGEEFPDIGLQDIPVTTGKLLAAIHGGVGPLSLAAGVAVEDERPLEDRLEYAGQGVMHHPVAEWRRADLAGLALVDRERAVGSGAVGLARELLVEPGQLPLQVEEEPGRRGTKPLSPPGLLRGPSRFSNEIIPSQR